MEINSRNSGALVGGGLLVLLGLLALASQLFGGFDRSRGHVLCWNGRRR
jgi:hypothetical protein